MSPHVAFALAHPVYDPEKHILKGHYFRASEDISACLTVNIGQE